MSESIVEKIKKLLRLAQSSNVHEAELALARAFELAQKHQVDVSILDLDEESERITHEWFTIGARVSLLKQRAIGIVITFFNVNACISRERHGVVFVGSATEVQIAWYVYGFIIQQGTRHLREYEAAEKIRRRRMTPNKRRGFIQGFIYGISIQLGDRKEAATIEDSRTAIVFGGAGKQRDCYMATLIPETRKIVLPKSRNNNDSLWSGFVCGKSTTINKPLSGTREGQLLLA
jgi:Protein of unknown function (DUF2786)